MDSNLLNLRTFIFEYRYPKSNWCLDSNHILFIKFLLKKIIIIEKWVFHILNRKLVLRGKVCDLLSI